MERIILQTDSEVGAQSQHIGTDPLTGLEMYRRFRVLLSETYIKTHLIHYEEWLVASDGNTYKELYRQKKYQVKNNPAIYYAIGEPTLEEHISDGTQILRQPTYDGDGNETSPAVYYREGEILPIGFLSDGKQIKRAAFPNYTRWFNQLAPVLLPPINQTLRELPFDAIDGYTTSA